MPNNKREKIPEGTLCVVCEDLASGVHYGVASCNGCKTFFRRALVNKQAFTCQFNGDCVVGKSVRCVCRSCRLKKCFDTGMDPKAIQHDRDKIRYTKALRKQKEEEKAKEKQADIDVSSPTSAGSNEYMNTSTPSSSTMLNEDPMLEQDMLSEVKSMLSSLLKLEEKMLAIRNGNRFEPHTSATSCMYQRCLFEDDQWLTSNSAPSSPPSPQACTLVSLRSWFVKDLSLMMEWGKSLPIMDKLLLNDKLALMKSFAPIFPLVQLAFYTQEQDEMVVIKTEPGEAPAPLPPDRLTYPDGTFIERVSDISNTSEMYSILIDGVHKMMRRLQLQRHHIVLYKLLLLHNPDAEGLSKPGKTTIEEQRMRILSLLFVCISSERGKTAASLYSNLLMMTATLSRVASFIRRVFDINHIFDRTNDLIDQLIIVGL